MHNCTRNILLILFSALLLSACTKFRKLTKSDDLNKKYEAAMEYYEQKDYYRSSVLLEQILPILKGSEKAERANFIYAYTYYYQDQFLLASHYFRTFYTTYSRSEFAPEARFMYGYALFMDSPRYNLEQTSTKQSITALQSFINLYPSSKFVPKAETALNSLQNKLEKKAYTNAMLYYKLRKYMTGEYLKAALVTFNNFQNDYPDSEYIEEIRFHEIEAMYKLAEISTRNKQKERYTEAVNFYLDYIEDYPQGEYVRKAESIYEDAQNELRKINI